MGIEDIVYLSLKNTITKIIKNLLVFSLSGCTAVFNSNNKFSLAENLKLTINCSLKSPINLKHNCEPSIEYTAGTQSKFSLTPNFELVNNSCTKLNINSSTGEIIGTENMLEVSSQCTYQVQVTQGSKTVVSDPVTLTGSNAINFKYSKEHLIVKKGEQIDPVRVEFSESLPFKVDIEYEFFSSTEGSVPFLNLSNKRGLLGSQWKP